MEIKKSDSHIRQRTVEKFMNFINNNLKLYTLKTMCSVLKFSRSTYYAVKNRKFSKKTQQYQEFSDKVKSIFEASKKDTVLQKFKKN